MELCGGTHTTPRTSALGIVVILSVFVSVFGHGRPIQNKHGMMNLYYLLSYCITLVVDSVRNTRDGKLYSDKIKWEKSR